MKVEQISVGNSLKNYTYILYDKDSANSFIIDPYDASQCINFLTENKLRLKMILNTHSHFDHIKGNKALQAHFDCAIWKPKAGDELSLNCASKFFLKSNFLPGHSKDHYAFSLEDGETITAFFAGDLLFDLGVGNTRNGGDLESLFESVSEASDLVPRKAQFFPGHDYKESNFNFSESILPKTLIQSDEGEKSFGYQLDNNLFLLFNKPSIRKEVALKFDFDELNEKEYFKLLRLKRDKW